MGLMDKMTIWFYAIILAVLFLILLGMAFQCFPVIKTYHIVSDKLLTEQRIALLTDLHGCLHGRKNARLLRMLDKASPDYICIAGDMTVKSGEFTEDMLELLQELVKKYPVYYAPGNHEIRMPQYNEYRLLLRQYGVQYLENEVFPIGGNVLVYGLDLPEYWYHKVWEKREMSVGDITECLGECDEKCFSILLAHNPEYFPQYAQWGADLTLSGHVHGGIVRLPWLGGVIAPSLQLFPHYDAGLFEEGGRRMIISRGLGLHHVKVRYFNRPELSVINLSCQETDK